EPSVWTGDLAAVGEYAVRARLSVCLMTGCARYGHAALSCPNERRSVRPGAEPTTYRFVGFSFEHGNLNRSAEDANLGKLPSPATSPVRDGVSAVVRARESRVHGEGRQ